MSSSTVGSSEERQIRGGVTRREQRARNAGGVATPKVSTDLGARRTRGQSASREKLEVGGSNPSPRAIHRRPFYEWKKPLGRPECPFTYRWLLDFRAFSIRLHHWVGSDDLRAPHDHAWWFITLPLKGRYADIQPNRTQLVRSGRIYFRHAEHRHSVKLLTPDAWTLVLTGRHVRPMCFWPNGKRVKANKWFITRGLHPCQD